MAKKPLNSSDKPYIKKRVDALAYEDAERNYPTADPFANSPIRSTTGGIKSTRTAADTSKNQRPDPRL